jgi:hypothetical protein
VGAAGLRQKPLTKILRSAKNLPCDPVSQRFLGEAMVLGISLALLLLPGGAAATATPPDGPPFAEHDIPISDDPGGGGGCGCGCVKNYRNCWIENNIGPAQKSVVHWTRKSDGKTGKTYQMELDEANRWKDDNCD